MKFALLLLCGVAASLQLAHGPAAAARKADAAPAQKVTAAAPAPAAVKHGGKIDMKYDGFNYETVVSLRKMQVTCGSGKGFKDISKDVCVSLAVWLHCPGQQLDFVRRARVQLIFEAEEWDRRHTPAERGLTVVADGETMRLGSMSLVSNEVGSGLLVDKSKEVLEISIPYDAFVKIARSDSVEVRVGSDVFPLRDKNVAALRDLSSRVKPKG